MTNLSRQVEEQERRLFLHIDQSSPTVQLLADAPHVREVLALVNKLPIYQLDADALEDELDLMLADVKLAAFDFDQGVGALDACIKARFQILAKRDRIVFMVKDLRKLESKLDRVHSRALLALHQVQLPERMTVKSFEATSALVLDDITTRQRSASLLLDYCEMALKHLDAKARTLDAWYLVYQRYAYERTAKHPSQPRDEEAQAPGPRRLL